MSFGNFQFRKLLDVTVLKNSKIISEISPRSDFWWTPETILQTANHDGVWVVEKEGEILGFVLYRNLGTEAEILTTFVSLEARGQGLMTQLLSALITGHPHEKWFLEVHSENTAALRTYERVGFKKIAVRSAYYRDGKDAFVLQFSTGLTPVKL